MRAADRTPTLPSAVLISAAVAVVYGVLGWISLGLGQMTGLAAPLWPAAGVAFAASFLWGWRAWAGILFGSLAVNAYWVSQTGELPQTVLITAAAIGVGATAEAALGAALVRRFVGRDARLDTPRTALLTLLLAGPVACVVGPTVGVATQVSTGLLGASAAPLGWLTWWVGDAIGVIVFAPIALMLIPSQARFWSGRRWKIAVPSLLIVGTLMGAIVQNTAVERDRDENAVAQLGAQAAADLSSNIGRHQEVLEGVRGLMDASDNVTAAEFDTYTDDVLSRFPNLQALSWNPLVTQADLAAFEVAQRAQPGLADFTVTQRNADGELEPVTPRPEYVVVAYIEPLANNQSALGYDIYSNPARAEAIETARDTGAPTATAPIELVQESGTQKGMLALLPVYDGGVDPGSEEARRTSLRGFAVGVYRLGDLLAETYAGATWDDVDITLVDVTNAADPVVIADLAARTPASVDEVSGGPTATTQPLNVYGRSWELTVHPTNTAFLDRSNGFTIILLLASLALAFLLEAFLLVLSGLEIQARREAERSAFEASHDPLTGLSNRRAFVRDLEALLARPDSPPAVLLFCDLDGFKEVNDTAGHAVGDAMLVAVARTLAGSVRDDDFVSRMGGDEFAVLLTECSVENGRAVADHLVTAIDAVRLAPPESALSVGVSIGAAVVDPSSGASLDEYLRRADAACYAAKRAGRGQVRTFDDLASPSA